MSNAVWVLVYGIEDADRSAYLDWYHDVHIPEKLDRPGYTWAAHFETHGALESPAGRAGRGYVALFGGESTRVFHDPSPSQLKERQNALTREMSALRFGAGAVVVCEEWRTGGGPAVAAPVICLECLDAAGNDEDLVAWCAQEGLPAAAARPGCLGARKWLRSSGRAGHVLLAEFDTPGAAAPLTSHDGEWARRLDGYAGRPLGPARIARRLFPSP